MSSQEKEREKKPFVAPEPAPAVEARDDVRAATSPVRCPYCHTDVSPDARDWVVCRQCLARHHQGCWSESGACASCRGTEALGATEARPRPAPGSRDKRAALVLAVFASFFVAGLVAGVVSFRKGASMATVPSVADVERGQRLFKELRSLLAKYPTWTFDALDEQGRVVRSTNVPFHELGLGFDTRASNASVVVLSIPTKTPSHVLPDEPKTRVARIQVRVAGVTLGASEFRQEPLTNNSLLLFLEGNAVSPEQDRAIEAALATPPRSPEKK